MKILKKIIRILFVSALVCFSFYYTEKSVNLVKYTDPIMKEIKNNEKEVYEKEKNAIIDNDCIISGYNGLKVDYEKSYTAMKRIGNYDKGQLVLKEVKPDISIDNNYDKYIIKGNYLKDTVGLVFVLNNNTNIEDITKVLDDKLVTSTFITTNKYLEDHTKEIYNLAKEDYEVELSISDYEDLVLSRNTLKNIINYSGEYCYFDNKNEEVLSLCKKAKMHSVLPTFSVSNFKDLKDNLESGAIIKINDSALKELSTLINYIKQRGYTLENLTYLLSEERTLK